VSTHLTVANLFVRLIWQKRDIEVKHHRIRLYIVAIAFFAAILTAFYFDSYKIGGPRILIPLSKIERGLLFLITGVFILFDSFFSCGKSFSKRKKYLFDQPFMISLFYVGLGLLSLIYGISEFISGQY
jgi:hypothetical protein